MITAVLGKPDYARNFGKKGTVSDIALYDIKQGEQGETFVEPNMYPEKIQSLLTAIDMCDSVILYVSKEIMNFQLAEMILSLNHFKKTQGVLIFDGVVPEQVEAFIKDTVVEQYKIADSPVKTKEVLSSFKFSKTAPGNTAIIDHSFQVKSVGDVFLGIVLSGKVKQYDKLKLFPAKKEILIKSLQVHDVDVKEVAAGKRIGGSVKGCELEDLKRGAIVSDHDFSSGKEFLISFEKNKFFTFDIPKTLLGFVGMQWGPCEFENNKVKFEKDVVYSKGQQIVLFEPSRKIRIAGFGVIQ